MSKSSYILSFLLLIWCSGLYAQDVPNLDNFEKGFTLSNIILKNNTGPEIDKRITNAFMLRADYPDSSIKLLYGTYSESKILYYNYGVASSLLLMGSVYLVNKGEPLKALALTKQAYPYCLPTMNPDKKAQLMVHYNNCMGGVYGELGRYDSAAIFFYRALQMARLYKWDKPGDLAMIYNNLGYAYYAVKQHTKAKYYVQQAIATIQDAYIPQAITKARKADAIKQLARSYYILATMAIDEKQYDQTKLYLDKIYELHIPPNEKVTQMTNEIYYRLYLAQRDPEKAIPYIKASLNSSIQHKSGIAYAQNELGYAYYLLHDYKKAREYMLQAVQGAKAEGVIHLQQAIYKVLTVVSDSLGNYEDAYRYKSLDVQLQDSIDDVAKSKNINEMETRYRTAEKDKQITADRLKLVAAENRLNKKNMWMGGIIAGSLILILVLVPVFQRQRLQLQKANAREQQQKIDELKAVIDGEEKERSRIGRQLHDDVMVEFSIAKMNLAALPIQHPEIARIDDFKNILEQLNNASIKLRQTAHNIMPDALLEEGLVTAILYFCKGIERMAHIHINFQYYGDMPRLHIDTEISIYRIVQELIQNIIKHASASSALVQINYRKNNLNITIEDDGIGIVNTENKLEHGMGFKSIRTRLKSMGGDMEVHQREPHGTSITIEISV